jgi:nicotinamide-nucleotide amidase
VGALHDEAEEGGGREVTRAAVVAIGDELTAGEHVDSNSSEIATRLAELGIEVERFVVLGDDAGALASVFRELAREHAVIVATGGLGPTLDDVTREAAAAAAGVELERSSEVLEWLREMWRARTREMPAANERQAWFPRTSQILPNRAGTAPGFRLVLDRAQLFVLPGPPREMRDLLAREVLPWLEEHVSRRRPVAAHRFHLLGLAESAFGDRAGEWMARGASPLMGVTAHQGVLCVTLRARGDTSSESLAARCREFRERFAAEIFSEDDPRPAFAVGRALLERGITLALAESCTGGLVSALLTEVPGISAVFREGWVTYSNEAKVVSLGVPSAAIERHGAVSSQVAEAMALGAARESRARMSVAITGVAGPDGGTPQKPVGLVWFGVCVDGRVSSREQRYPQVDRATIRQFAANTAFDLVRRSLPAD